MRTFFALLILFWPPAAAVAAADVPACRATCSWPIRFFAGQTVGNGRLRVLFLPARTVKVRSTGRLTKGGTLILRQTIGEAGEKPRTREWRLGQTGPGRYKGTLSDASGPVFGEVSGNRLHLSYTMKGAFRLRIDQQLELQPGGRSVRNRLTASKLGLPLARLDETIRKAD